MSTTNAKGMQGLAKLLDKIVNFCVSDGKSSVDTAKKGGTLFFLLGNDRQKRRVAVAA
jgi:hypothetical protein